MTSYPAHDPGDYPVTIGRAGLKLLGINANYDKMTFEWHDIAIQMKPCAFWTQSKMTDQLQSITHKIHDAKYEEADLPHIASLQHHLQPSQQQELLSLLTKYASIFSGKKG